MTTRGYATKKPSQTLQLTKYDTKPLTPIEVAVKISHCGVCYSDLRVMESDQGDHYPIVPGHEVVGTVIDKGAAVQHLDIGQRVGIGWQSGACMHCRRCLEGDEVHCKEFKRTCVDGYGGFAEAIQVNSNFAFAVPDALQSEYVGPLMCGGATVFRPLLYHIDKPLTKVGVIGIGGLGHMAIQFAHAFGCEVTAISRSTAKQAEAKGFGAHHFIDSTNASDMQQAMHTQDLIINTAIADIQWEPYLNLLHAHGKIALVGIPKKPLSIPVRPLIDIEASIVGSHIGSVPDIHRMLSYAAKNNIKPQIEQFPMSDVNQALAKLRAGKMRYRGVLVSDW